LGFVRMNNHDKTQNLYKQERLESETKFINEIKEDHKDSEVKKVPKTYPSSDGWFSSSVLAKEFGYDVCYVAAIARQGKVQAVKTDNKWFIKRGSLVAYQIQAKQNQINSGIKEVPKVQVAKTDTINVPYIAPSSLPQRASNPVIMGKNPRATFVVLLFLMSMITGTLFFSNNKATILDFIRNLFRPREVRVVNIQKDFYNTFDKTIYNIGKKIGDLEEKMELVQFTKDQEDIVYPLRYMLVVET